MRATIGFLVVAAVLAGSGLLAWRGSELERRVAAAERDLVTLRYQEAGARAVEPPPAWSSWLPGAGKTVEDARALSATSKYWEGDYDAVAADPNAKLLAANAAYRAVRRDGGNWQAVVGRLDGVVKTYADVLRENPDSAEAAFNFDPEFEKRVTVGVNTTGDIVDMYQREYPKRIARLRSTPGAQLAKEADFFSMMKQPAVMFLGIANNHGIHHRGQLASYLRAMGSKVPSMYGGSADEPM